MTTARTTQQAPAFTGNAVMDAYIQIEDASRDIQRSASLLAKYWELEATQYNEDDIKMFAAMALEDAAHDIIKNLQTILDAADALRHAATGGAK